MRKEKNKQDVISTPSTNRTDTHAKFHQKRVNRTTNADSIKSESKPNHIKPRRNSKIEVLYEDKYIVVINKSSGLLSVPYDGFRGKTAIDMLCESRRQRGMVHGSYRPLTVHRLDKDTSGVMMFALSPECQKRIMDNWQKMVTNRLYIALAENPSIGVNNSYSILPDSGVINRPLILNEDHHSFVKGVYNAKGKIGSHGRERLPGIKDEKQAITHYKVLKRGEKYTLFELELETGRTNQIRAHLSAEGYPLAGDGLYHAKTNPDGRLCLHARTLSFIHPYTGEKLKFEVPEPETWRKFI